jgi:hypothetical protein
MKAIAPAMMVRSALICASGCISSLGIYGVVVVVFMISLSYQRTGSSSGCKSRL